MFQKIFQINPAHQRIQKKYIIFSAVKRLIVINRIQNKSFCLHNICVCVYCVYVLCIYKYTHRHAYI